MYFWRAVAALVGNRGRSRPRGLRPLMFVLPFLAVSGGLSQSGAAAADASFSMETRSALALDAIVLAPSPLYEVLTRNADAIRSGATGLHGGAADITEEGIVSFLAKRQKVIETRVREHGLNYHNAITQFGSILGYTTAWFDRKIDGPVDVATVVYDGYQPIEDVAAALAERLRSGNIARHPHAAYSVIVNFVLDYWCTILAAVHDPGQIAYAPDGAYLKHVTDKGFEASTAHRKDLNAKLLHADTGEEESVALKGWVLDGCTYFAESMGRLEVADAACTIEKGQQARRVAAEFLADGVEIILLPQGYYGTTYARFRVAGEFLSRKLVLVDLATWRRFDETHFSKGSAGRGLFYSFQLEPPAGDFRKIEQARRGEASAPVISPLGPPIALTTYYTEQGGMIIWTRPHKR
ncbi:MAG: hypothetical protein HYV63_29105 [Candidatus Schekmanbacteria bacterium]|nr:hypothetical protein [Candidatus Schekmanbacteria bacterium]